MAVVLPAAPAAAIRPSNAARTYLEARSAAIEGNHSRSAQLLAQLVDNSAANRTIIKEAVPDRPQFLRRLLAGGGHMAAR